MASVTTSAAVCGLVMGATALVAHSPPFELPAPTGRYPIGTMSWRITDTVRRETFAATDSPRQVEVVAWYPAAPTTADSPAPYFREGLAEVQSFASLIRAPGAFDNLAGVWTHAAADVPTGSVGAKFPVLVTN